MPRVFNWYKVDNFPSLPVGQRVETGGQLGAWQDYPTRGAHSEVKFLGDSEHDSFKKYFVQHETERSIKHRFNGEIREVVIQIAEFYMFEHRDGYFLVDTSLKNLKELAGRLQDTWPEKLLQFRLRSIDLPSLKNHVDSEAGTAEIGGGYFQDLMINRVRAASIFGPDVGDSELWEEFSAKGQLTGVWLNFQFYGEPTSIMVTRYGGIVTFASFGEKTVLELVEKINALIEPFSKETILSARRRRQ
jgi:hypothetical protein